MRWLLQLGLRLIWLLRVVPEWRAAWSMRRRCLLLQQLRSRLRCLQKLSFCELLRTK